MEQELSIILLGGNGPKALTIYFLLFVIIFCLLGVVLCKEGNLRERLQKILGGISVLLVSLLAGNEGVYILGLIIGGLIIASEQFMQNIIAIFKTHPEHVDKTLGYITRQATPQEVKEKIESEAKAWIKVSAEDVDTKKDTETKKQDINKVRYIYQNVENLVHDYYLQIYGERYRKEVKIINDKGSFIADGGILSKVDPNRFAGSEILKRRNDIKFDNLVEIKYIAYKERVIATVMNTLHRIAFHAFFSNVRLALVVNGIIKSDANKIIKDLIRKFPNRPEVQYDIFSFDGENVKFLSDSSNVR